MSRPTGTHVPLDRVGSYQIKTTETGYDSKSPLRSSSLDQEETVVNDHVHPLAHYEGSQHENEELKARPVVVESMRGCIVLLGCVLIALPCMG